MERSRDELAAEVGKQLVKLRAEIACAAADPGAADRLVRAALAGGGQWQGKLLGQQIGPSQKRPALPQSERLSPSTTKELNGPPASASTDEAS